MKKAVTKSDNSSCDVITVRLPYSNGADSDGLSMGEDGAKRASKAFRDFISELRKRELLDSESLNDIEYVIEDYLNNLTSSFVESCMEDF